MKLSVICYSNKIPLVYELSKPQKSDIKGCIDMIPKINNNLKKKSFIMGDKGNVVNKNIKIVSNKRKNQLKQNIEKEKNLLKKRYLVENCFATIKNCFATIKNCFATIKNCFATIKNSYKEFVIFMIVKLNILKILLKWHLHVKL